MSYIEHTSPLSVDDSPAVITQAEWNLVKSQVQEVHTMLTDFTQMLEQIGKNPMLRTMVPGGLFGKK
jgi:hypothetical protein